MLTKAAGESGNNDGGYGGDGGRDCFCSYKIFYVILDFLPLN